MYVFTNLAFKFIQTLRLEKKNFFINKLYKFNLNILTFFKIMDKSCPGQDIKRYPWCETR